MENAVTLAANPPEGTVADREFGKLTQTTESDVAQWQRETEGAL